ncbi:hypothetical protein MHSWG343_10710 [Candidatus Mycoplasma haematohominis]|uniref:Uncharacterized protein n=1 Tax=Candidatus Mycoplasma haematohominis TaxID=1494318 RepID=A0A478FRC6_9MOLU|nr:hypothetical protein MHSWG343_10710 [Candidatus Mycoplasma haemohominis]
MDLAKIIISVGSLVVIGVGGYMFSPVFTNSPPMPDVHHTISVSTSFSKDYTSGTFGIKYGYLLVDPKKPENQNWWEWSLNRFYSDSKSDSLSAEFKGITDGYKFEHANSEIVFLSDVCEAAFKKQLNTVTGNYENDVWKYCSLSLIKPLTVEESSDQGRYSGTPEKIGNTSKSILMSVENPLNKDFWDLRTGEFFRKGSIYFPTSSTDNSFFKKFYEDNKNKFPKPNLREKCGESYEKDADNSTSSQDKPTKTEVIKFCSLKGSE